MSADILVVLVATPIPAHALFLAGVAQLRRIHRRIHRRVHRRIHRRVARRLGHHRAVTSGDER
jgi:hypothetical protein